MPKKASPKIDQKPKIPLNDQPLWIRNILRCALAQSGVTIENLHSHMVEAAEGAASVIIAPWDEILFEVADDKNLFPLFLYHLRMSASVGNNSSGHITASSLDALGLMGPVTFNSGREELSSYLDPGEVGVEITDPFDKGLLSDDDPDDRLFEVLSCSTAAFVARLAVAASKDTNLQRAIANAGFTAAHS